MNYGAHGNPEEYTARWLYRKVTEMEPKNVELWWEWVVFEREQANFGTPGNPEEYTARWLVTKVLTIDPDYADLEQTLDEIEMQEYLRLSLASLSDSDP
jgi:hypothetical protein